MGKFILKDVKVLFDGRDLSGELSNVSIEYSAETPDKTSFGDTTRTRLPGILDVVATHQGWWDIVSAADDLDADLIAQIGAASALMSMSGEGGTLGDFAYSFPTQAAAVTRGGSHGEIMSFSITVNADGPLVRGPVMENGVFTVTADGTARQVGAAIAGESIYSTLHVVAASGTTPTIDVTLESDATNSFSGSETLRITHPQLAVVGSDRQILAGPVTDTWWRYTITISGGSPSFTIFLSLGIQTTLT